MYGDSFDQKKMDGPCPICDGEIIDGICTSNGLHQICPYCGEGILDKTVDPPECTNMECEYWKNSQA